MTAAKIFQPARNQSLISGLILVGITALLLFLARQTDATSSISQVFIIISGMTTVAALSALSQSWQTGSSEGWSQISFNQDFASRSIAEGLANVTINVKAEEVTPSQVLPWDLNLSQYVGLDNSFALAKLRIELERELRRIAYQNKIDISARPVGAIPLARELASKDLLPLPWLEVIKEIAIICNKAVHGLEVSDETTLSVVITGGQLLEQLRLIDF